MKTICLVGLGNPGEKYQQTYHNLGFMVLDSFLDSVEVGHKFSFSKKHNSDIAELVINETKLILVKPQTFMNRSGHAARSVLDYYDLSFENDLLVVHDDLDLPFGKIRFSHDSGPAGHNGVKSIIEQLGSKNFVRLRFGIAKDIKTVSENKSDNLVLKKIPAAKQSELPKLMKICAESIMVFADQGFEQAANQFNQDT